MKLERKKKQFMLLFKTSNNFINNLLEPKNNFNFLLLFLYSIINALFILNSANSILHNYFFT